VKERQAGSNKKMNLLDEEEDDYISAQISLQKVIERPSPKPIGVVIPYPFYNPDEGFEMCLIVKVRGERRKGRRRRRRRSYLRIVGGRLDLFGCPPSTTTTTTTTTTTITTGRLQVNSQEGTSGF